MPKRKAKINQKKIKTKNSSKAALKCMRCEKTFSSRKALKMHSHTHLQALQELKMLEEGFIPVETKLGSDFKGKNRVIVS